MLACLSFIPIHYHSKAYGSAGKIGQSAVRPRIVAQEVTTQLLSGSNFAQPSPLSHNCVWFTIQYTLQDLIGPPTYKPLMRSLSTEKNSRSRPSCGAIILPALNELAVIGEVIIGIRRTSNLPIWVIDDCSADATSERASSLGAKSIRLSEQLGAWGAVQTGLREAARMNLDFVVTMDADGQHDPSNIPDLIEPVINREAEVVIGCYPDRGSKLRRLAWSLMRLTSGLVMADPTSGYRVLNKRAIRLLSAPAASQLEFQDIGVLLMLERAQFRIQEQPVTMKPRSNGKSRIFRSWALVAYYMAQTLLLGAAKRRKSPRHIPL